MFKYTGFMNNVKKVYLLVKNKVVNLLILVG